MHFSQSTEAHATTWTSYHRTLPGGGQGLVEEACGVPANAGRRSKGPI